jgi:hypothetical protein
MLLALQSCWVVLLLLAGAILHLLRRMTVWWSAAWNTHVVWWVETCCVHSTRQGCAVFLNHLNIWFLYSYLYNCVPGIGMDTIFTLVYDVSIFGLLFLLMLFLEVWPLSCLMVSMPLYSRPSQPLRFRPVQLTLYLKLHFHIHPPFLLYGVTQFYHVPFVIFSTYSGHYCQGGAWWRRNCNWLVRRSCDQPCVPSHLWVAPCTFPQEDRCRGQVQRLAKVIS